MLNKRWCNDSKLTSTLCSRDLETSTVDCRPFYSPRKFASIVLIGVYIPFLFLSSIVHPSWVSQAPRVLSYCADALVFGP